MTRARAFFVEFLRLLGLIVGGGLVWYFGTVTVLLFVYRSVDPPLSTLQTLRWVQGVEVKPTRPLPLAEIPKVARTGIIYLEDHQFWTHHGIVLGAIREAWEANQRLGRAAYGGSTITQQLARTLFLFPDRWYLRKGLEAGTAVLMELILPKERILELYLNSIEWGPGVFGIDAGARHHYGVGIRKLTREQIARLEAIITNPVAFNVKTYARQPGMAARYRALMNR